MNKREDRIFVNFIFNRLLIYFGKTIIEKSKWEIGNKLCLNNYDDFKNLFIKKCDSGVLIRDLKKPDPLVCIVEFKIKGYLNNYDGSSIEAQYEYKNDGLSLSIDL